MSLANKKFVENKTGKIIKVIDNFEDIAILENKDKVSVKVLMNSALYTEYLDPNDFFQDQSVYNSLANKIKQIPTDNLPEDSPISIEGTTNMQIPMDGDSAIIYTTEEDEKAELARKYGVSLDNDSTIQ